MDQSLFRADVATFQSTRRIEENPIHLFAATADAERSSGIRTLH